MKYKQGQRVAYYEVTGKSDPCAAKVEVGDLLIDRPRGLITSWDFMNMETGERSWIAAKRVGFARADNEDSCTPEPALQRYLDERKAKEES